MRSTSISTVRLTRPRWIFSCSGRADGGSSLPRPTVARYIAGRPPRAAGERIVAGAAKFWQTRALRRNRALHFYKKLVRRPRNDGEASSNLVMMAMMVDKPDASDTELIGRARDGDEGAFGQLVERHYDFVYRVAYRWCGRKADAEDVAQDVCVRLGSAIHAYRGAGAFTTWLYALTLNAARDMARRTVREAAKTQAYGVHALIGEGRAGARVRDPGRDALGSSAPTAGQAARRGAAGLRRGTEPRGGGRCDGGLGGDGLVAHPRSEETAQGADALGRGRCDHGRRQRIEHAARHFRAETRRRREGSRAAGSHRRVPRGSC